jgi:hypothetical protein
MLTPVDRCRLIIMTRFLDCLIVFAVCGPRFSTHPPQGHMPAPRRRTLPKKPPPSKYHVPKITIDHIDEPESKIPHAY